MLPVTLSNQQSIQQLQSQDIMMVNETNTFQPQPRTFKLKLDPKDDQKQLKCDKLDH